MDLRTPPARWYDGSHGTVPGSDRCRARTQSFIVADGRRLERDIGYALVRAAGAEAPDLVVFAEPGDLVLLGVHSLAGLNLRVDPVRKELIPAGPVITGCAA